ncbi:MAG: lytic transglycosylase domain-containing protein [Peptococcaceae bacterium]|nr:lytic transglycosylase domain-containing protein [Peptococcaceae bacterium]
MYVIKLTKTKLLIILLALFIVVSYKYDIFEKILYPYPHKQTIEKYAIAYGVDPLFVTAVIREESHFIPYSSSHKGAVGLMQLMPETAREIAVWLGEDYAKIDLTKPEDNIRYGTWYLATLNKQYSGNHILVLAAYNAGSGRVSKWLASSPRDLNSYLIDDIPFKETRDYVQKVLASYKKYTSLYAE